jgi:hypothetical protein
MLRVREPDTDAIDGSFRNRADGIAKSTTVLYAEIATPFAQEDGMPTDEILIRLFLIVDEQIGNIKKRSDANLYASEIVTLGLFFSLKGGRYRAFYRWLAANFGQWFPKLPEVTRLHRLLEEHAELTDTFLAQPTFFSVLDTFGIELIHPRREGRSPNQIGEKGVSNGRWIVGVKLGWLINDRGEVVDWDWDTASAPDNVFRATAFRYDGQTVALCDFGLRAKGEPQRNLKFCPRGSWNERFTVETDFSWLTELLHAKKMYHRVAAHLVARFQYLAALLNCLLRITGGKRSLLQFVI